MKRIGLFALCGLATALLAPVVHAQNTLGVYSTGVTSSDVLITEGAADTYWTVVAPTADDNASGDADLVPSWVTPPSGTPDALVTTPNPAWTAGGATGAEWISANSSGEQSEFTGDYYYTEAFYVPTGATDEDIDLQYTADNAIEAVTLNGISTGLTAIDSPSYDTYGGIYPSTGYSVISSANNGDFIAGQINYLTFTVWNQPNGDEYPNPGNPEALYVNIVGAYYDTTSTPLLGGPPTPEPSSLIALIAGGGLLGLVLLGRKVSGFRTNAI